MGTIEKLPRSGFEGWLKDVNKIVVGQCRLRPVTRSEGIRMKAAGMYAATAAKEAVALRTGARARLTRQRAADKEQRSLDWEAKVNQW